MSLLLDESPVFVQPSLVRRLGLLEAAIVQQLHYWSQRATRSHEEHVYVYKTYQDWSDEIGVSAKAARGAMDRLRKDGVVVGIQNPTDLRDRTLWWRIDHEVLDRGARSAPEGISTPPRGGSPAAPEGTSNAGASQRGTSTTSETTQRARARNRPTVDPDALPDDFPPGMLSVLEETMASLMRAAESRGAPMPARAAVARAMVKRPRKPHAAVAERVEHWLLYGNGQRASCRDVVARWRDWCDQEADVATERPALAAAAGNVHRIGGNPVTRPGRVDWGAVAETLEAQGL
jgi:hypothetical protein